MNGVLKLSASAALALCVLWLAARARTASLPPPSAHRSLGCSCTGNPHGRLVAIFIGEETASASHNYKLQHRKFALVRMAESDWFVTLASLKTVVLMDDAQLPPPLLPAEIISICKVICPLVPCLL